MKLEQTNKDCTKCTKYLPLSAFHKNRTKPMGVESQCKRCRSLHYNEVRHGKQRRTDKRD